MPFPSGRVFCAKADDADQIAIAGDNLIAADRRPTAISTAAFSF